MNNIFKNHVNSASFNLSLSKNMIICLLDYYNGTEHDEQLIYATNSSLIKRGLLSRTWEGVFITEEGELVAQLLMMSGYGE